MSKLLFFTSSSSFTCVCLNFLSRILYPVFSDLWGLVTLGIATSYYLKFNAVMYFNLEEEAPSSLYLYGDYWYVVNSLVYTLCAMRDNECFWFMPTNGRPPALLDIAKAHYFSNLNEKVFDEVDIGGTTLKSGADKSSSSKSGGGWSTSGKGKGKGKGSSGCDENDDGVHDALLSSSRVEDEDDDARTGRDRDSRKERDREREKEKESMRESRGRGSAVTADGTADLGPVSGINKGSFQNCPPSSSVILRSNVVATNANGSSGSSVTGSGNGLSGSSVKESAREVKEMSIFSIIGYGTKRST